MENKKEQWNQFIAQNKGSFLQSYQWGEFQELLKRKIWRIEVQGLKGLIIKHDLPLGKNYLYCPRGPVVQGGDISMFLKEVKSISQQEKSIFFKIEPEIDLNLTEFGFKKSLKEIQPSKTVILNIDQSKEELLEQMHHKTRYNIRLAEKKGVTVQEIDLKDKESINIFIDLLEQTAQRDKFHIHSKEHYQKMLGISGIKLFLAKYQDKIIAGILNSFFNQTAIYMHGASDYNYRKLMAPYLLQWQAIIQAKEQGLKYYDFGGINQEKWPGITRFKKGFLPCQQAGNDQETHYPGAFDLVYRQVWFLGYNLARKIL
ncbi:MAG: peptidoglycan bridge formation glycyltransferase FemA/FemB family protein [Candidatus Portnoybacteria bacterium]|nr:peptidoglycan bridge formation glycyltransferase FemA/FemB family protein [Candidatus Portnoybacteria bacterium]